MLLCEILHLVDIQDLIHLYGWVTKYFKSHTADNVGLLLLGDLHVLHDSSYYTGKGFKVWLRQETWEIISWQYFPLSHVHMIFTNNGKSLYMWGGLIYPLTITDVGCQVNCSF